MSVSHVPVTFVPEYKSGWKFGKRSSYTPGTGNSRESLWICASQNPCWRLGLSCGFDLHPNTTEKEKNLTCYEFHRVCFRMHSMYKTQLELVMSRVSECKRLECEHFCVSLGGGRGQCVCADGYYLELDRKSCLCKSLPVLVVVTMLEHHVTMSKQKSKKAHWVLVFRCWFSPKARLHVFWAQFQFQRDLWPHRGLTPLDMSPVYFSHRVPLS